MKLTKQEETTWADANLPDFIDRELWDEFMEVRREKKAVQTDRALKRQKGHLIDFARSGHNPNEVLDHVINAEWKSVHWWKPVHAKRSPDRETTRDAIRRYCGIDAPGDEVARH